MNNLVLKTVDKKESRLNKIDNLIWNLRYYQDFSIIKANLKYFQHQYDNPKCVETDRSILSWKMRNKKLQICTLLGQLSGDINFEIKFDESTNAYIFSYLGEKRHFEIECSRFDFVDLFITVNWYKELIIDIKKLVFEGIVKTKHSIGKRILQDKLRFGKPKYGSRTIENLSRDLGVSPSDLYACIQFAKKFPEIPTTLENLPWREVLKQLPEHKRKRKNKKKEIIDEYSIFTCPHCKNEYKLRQNGTSFDIL